MNCNYKVKITDIQTKYKFKVFCTGYDDSEIKEKIDTMYEAWPKATAEGETPTLDNTANATMSIDLKGNGGNNLLPQDKYITTTTKNGIAYTNNGDGTFNLSGTASANTTIEIIPNGSFQLEANQSYYLYSSVLYNGTTFNMSIPMTDNGTTKFLLANNTYTPTTTPTNVRLQFYIASGQSVDQTNIKLMLVKGTTAPTDYEPYGASVTGDNTINICGKNLFNKDNVINGYRLDSNGELTLTDNNCCTTDYYIKVKPNTTYYSTQIIGGTRCVCCYDKDKNHLTRLMYLNVNTFTTVANTEYIKVSLYKENINDEQIEQGNQETTYEPYQSQSYPINIGTTKLITGDSIQGSIDNWNIVRASGTTEAITDATLISQLNNLRYNAESYSGQTNISQVNNDKPFIITTKALKDLSNL